MMKVYRSKNQLKLYGKAWEIRTKLREFSRLHLTLKEYLELFHQ